MPQRRCQHVVFIARVLRSQPLIDHAGRAQAGHAHAERDVLQPQWLDNLRRAASLRAELENAAPGFVEMTAEVFDLAIWGQTGFRFSMVRKTENRV